MCWCARLCVRARVRVVLCQDTCRRFCFHCTICGEPFQIIALCNRDTCCCVVTMSQRVDLAEEDPSPSAETNYFVVTLPGDLKTTLRTKVTEKLGTEPENYAEDEAVEGDGDYK